MTSLGFRKEINSIRQMSDTTLDVLEALTDSLAATSHADERFVEVFTNHILVNGQNRFVSLSKDDQLKAAKGVNRILGKSLDDRNVEFTRSLLVRGTNRLWRASMGENGINLNDILEKTRLKETAEPITAESLFPHLFSQDEA